MKEAHKNVKILPVSAPGKEKEAIYVSIREKEERLYNDETVAVLPAYNKASSLAQEWKVRASTCEHLKKYLNEKNKSLHLLDLGCGNGWLSNAICRDTDFKVTGVDINHRELEQACRVFGDNKNIEFIYGDIFEKSFSEERYDIILVVAAIQYFPRLDLLILRLMELLKQGGEINILDSPLYAETELANAKERSSLYFENLGFKEIKAYYHHHSWNELNGFSFNLYNRSPVNRLVAKFYKKNYLLFPWIIIKKNDGDDAI